MTFAERLRFMRIHANLTQQQLADRLGVPQSTVGRWETGNSPGVHWLPRIAKALGCKPDRLIAQ